MLELLAVIVVLIPILLSIMGTAGAAGMTPLQFALMTILLAGGAVLFSLSLSPQIRPGSRLRLCAPRSLAILGAACLAFMAACFPWRPSESFLDDAGNAKALAALRASQKKDNLQVTVTGDVQGDSIKVSNLKLR